VTLLPRTFAATEVMRGTHHFVDPALGGPEERLFYFRIDWTGALPAAFDPRSRRFLTFDTVGHVYVGGLTPAETPCRGTMKVDYFRSKTIRYDLSFEHAGETWRFEGEKVGVDLSNPVMLVKTHTTCYGTLRRGGGAVASKSVTHFEPQTIVPFLASFRLR
jgi:hypothetical protein